MMRCCNALERITAARPSVNGGLASHVGLVARYPLIETGQVRNVFFYAKVARRLTGIQAKPEPKRAVLHQFVYGGGGPLNVSKFHQHTVLLWLQKLSCTSSGGTYNRKSPRHAFEKSQRHALSPTR